MVGYYTFALSFTANKGWTQTTMVSAVYIMNDIIFYEIGIIHPPPPSFFIPQNSFFYRHKYFIIQSSGAVFNTAL